MKTEFKDLKSFCSAGFPIVGVPTSEPNRLREDLYRFCADNKYILVSWDCSASAAVDTFTYKEGNLVRVGTKPETVFPTKSMRETGTIRFTELLKLLTELVQRADVDGDPTQNALLHAFRKEYGEKTPFRVLLFVQDFAEIMSKPPGVRAVVDLVRDWQALPVTAVVTDADLKVSSVLSHDIAQLEYPLPNASDREAALDNLLEAARDKNVEPPSDDMRRDIVLAASGMAAAEMTNALYYSFIQEKSFSRKYVDRVFSLKTASLESTGYLKYLPPIGDLSEVGGNSAVKDWLKIQKSCMGVQEEDYNLPEPKGVLLAGIPGNGKSLLARCMAEAFERRAFQLNVDTLSGGIVGQTEARTTEVLKILDSMPDCLVLIDEIEKFFSKQGLEGHNASPGHQKAFARILDWMSSRKGGVYLVATANSLNMPSALLRKGRWDELFWVDNPSEDGRVSVAKIVLRRLRRDTEHNKKYVTELFRKGLFENWSGSEVEEVLNASVRFARHKNLLDPVNKDSGKWLDVVPEVANEMVPAERLRQEEYSTMREEAAGVLRPAEYNVVSINGSASLPKRKIHEPSNN